MKEILFKELSHIEKHKRKENPFIKKIKKGEKYNALYYLWSFPEEDKVFKLFGFLDFEKECIAKSDRFHYGDIIYSSLEEILKEENNIIFDEKEEKWYYKPYCVLHFLDGSQLTESFNTDEELKNYINGITDLNWKAIETI